MPVQYHGFWNGDECSEVGARLAVKGAKSERCDTEDGAPEKGLFALSKS
jgi:hypothetical protein